LQRLDILMRRLDLIAMFRAGAVSVDCTSMRKLLGMLFETVI
jgi:hypothetical protein